MPTFAEGTAASPDVLEANTGMSRTLPPAARGRDDGNFAGVDEARALSEEGRGSRGTDPRAEMTRASSGRRGRGRTTATAALPRRHTSTGIARNSDFLILSLGFAAIVSMIFITTDLLTKQVVKPLTVAIFFVTTASCVALVRRQHLIAVEDAARARAEAQNAPRLLDKDERRALLTYFVFDKSTRPREAEGSTTFSSCTVKVEAEQKDEEVEELVDGRLGGEVRPDVLVMAEDGMIEGKKHGAEDAVTQVERVDIITKIVPSPASPATTPSPPAAAASATAAATAATMATAVGLASPPADPDPTEDGEAVETTLPTDNPASEIGLSSPVPTPEQCTSSLAVCPGDDAGGDSGEKVAIRQAEGEPPMPEEEEEEKDSGGIGGGDDPFRDSRSEFSCEHAFDRRSNQDGALHEEGKTSSAINSPVIAPGVRPKMPSLVVQERGMEALPVSSKIGEAGAEAATEGGRAAASPVRANSGDWSTAGACIVCFGDYAHGEKLCRLPCRHVYHAECIDEWLDRARHPCCPLCKTNIFLVYPQDRDGNAATAGASTSAPTDTATSASGIFASTNIARTTVEPPDVTGPNAV